MVLVMVLLRTNKLTSQGDDADNDSEEFLSARRMDT